MYILSPRIMKHDMWTFSFSAITFKLQLFREDLTVWNLQRVSAVPFNYFIKHVGFISRRRSPLYTLKFKNGEPFMRSLGAYVNITCACKRRQSPAAKYFVVGEGWELAWCSRLILGKVRVIPVSSAVQCNPLLYCRCAPRRLQPSSLIYCTSMHTVSVTRV